MNRNEAIEYLTRCADANGVHWYEGRQWDDVDTCPTCKGSNDAGWLATPGSRYGHTSAHCAPIAWQAARIDGHVNDHNLDYWMGLVVNDSESPQTLLRDHAAELAGANTDAMVRGYLTCQLWLQTDHGRDDSMSGEPMLDENYGVDDIDSEYVDKVGDEFADLVVAHPLAVRMFLTHRSWYSKGVNGKIVREQRTTPDYDSEQFGHDFYLTREHHGAGFWDRGLGELGNYLTNIAHAAGSADDLWDNGNRKLA